MGNKYYATEMVKDLHPTGTLFAGRVISRGDDGDPFDSDEKLPKNKDLDGVLRMESAVVIIDASVRVWPHNKLNLIVVDRLKKSLYRLKQAPRQWYKKFDSFMLTRAKACWVLLLHSGIPIRIPLRRRRHLVYLLEEFIQRS